VAIRISSHEGEGTAGIVAPEVGKVVAISSAKSAAQSGCESEAKGDEKTAVTITIEGSSGEVLRAAAACVGVGPLLVASWCVWAPLLVRVGG